MSDLFNNPMIKRAKEAMTPEQLAEYEKIGKHMYDSISFETVGADGSKKHNNITKEMSDAVLYIDISIKSGQHISFLEDNEKALLKEVRGDKWYEYYGFTEQDQYGIV